jgi:hypothetical protein
VQRTQVGDSGFVSAGEHRGYLRGSHWVLKGETNCRSGSACSAPANGIHNHKHRPTLWSKKSVHIVRSPRFFHAVLGEIAPHRSDEFFRIRHDPILHYYLRRIVSFAANGENSPVSASVGPLDFEYGP